MIKDIINTSLQLFNLGKSRSQELLKAIRQGEIPKALEMIKSGVDVRVATASKTTALMLCSADKFSEVFCAILNSSTMDIAHLNEKDNAGNSVIHYAATFRSAYIEALVAKGVNIDSKNQHGQTPLLILCDNKHSSINTKEESLKFVKALVALKADVNIQDTALNSPLITAAISNDVELVQYLLSQGANPRLKNSNGYSAFRHSLELANKDMAISLILSLNNHQEIEANYTQSLKESTAYPDIKPTLEILKNKDSLQESMPHKIEKKEKSRKI